jgi:hypothetical protein
VSIKTQENTGIELQISSIQILVGGPYKINGEEHTYGHTALRVITLNDEHVYDFGRYNGETGPYGQGRLRVWTRFSRYIAGENATGRTTKGFLYRLPAAAADQVNIHFINLIGNRPSLKAYGDYMKEYKLARDYHALNNNCATTSMAGARVGIKDLDYNASKYNEGRGMSFAERAAARVAGWPPVIFMPADLQKMLEENPNHKPDKIEQFGSGK